MQRRAPAIPRDSIRRVPAVHILLDYRPALRQRTGVGEYVHSVAEALVATAPPGESLVLFSSSWKDRLPADRVPGAKHVDRRVPVRALNLLWHRLGWPPVEALTGTAFDVVQASHPLLVPSRSGARLVTIYDLDFLDHPERTQAEIRRDYGTLAATHARQADQIVVISQHTADAVRDRLQVPGSHISICVPGGPDWPRRDREPATGGCILFLGTLEPRKNLGVLLDAYERLLAQLPAAPPLVLAGGATPAAAAIVARAQRAPLAGHVELAGYVSPDAKRALYDRALVFVLPSLAEGFGMPVVEAMKAGVPVIASNRGALPEAGGTAAALVDPDDVDALAATLGDIVTSPERRRRMSDAGHVHAAAFTWARTAGQMRDAWALARQHQAERA